MLYIDSISLENVRCFGKLSLRLHPKRRSSNWTMLLGDNATGKSTLLRSIALGLCDEASAAGLLKESDEGYIRRGEDRAVISISLIDSTFPKSRYRIRTTISRKRGKRGIFSDIVRQTTTPRREEFPWDRLFVSGYGAGRGVTGAGDISGYSTIDAVYNMFNYTEGLQNPELVIRRLIARDQEKPIEDRDIFRLLCVATGADQIRVTSEGIRVDGPWGSGMPLRDLADGYKSSVLWITDLIGWALTFSPRRKSTVGIRGIVLIDELEQHLHVKWQRTIVDDLRSLFPNVQFIASTHSPLLGSSLGPTVDGKASDQLFVLERGDDLSVHAHPHEHMRGWRIDQILASRAFKYQIRTDPEIERALRLGSELATKKKLTETEKETYAKLQKILKDAYYASTSPIGRDVEALIRKETREEIAQLENELLENDDR